MFSECFSARRKLFSVWQEHDMVLNELKSPGFLCFFFIALYYFEVIIIDGTNRLEGFQGIKQHHFDDDEK